MNRKLRIYRDTDKVFLVTGFFPYWQDGTPIHERVAFNEFGLLSNTRAQSIDRANGSRYILVSPFGIKNPMVIEAARNLAVGMGVDVLV